MRLLSLPALWLAVIACAFAEPRPTAEFWPGASYDPRIPTLQQVLGYTPGERITSHAGIVRYLEALAAASPRLKLWTYGKTWEDRSLVYAAISSEANMKRLPELRAALLRFADPRKTSEAEARKLAASLPAVVWLGYGVHGNEISSCDAALLAAYHLLAARNDKMTDAILAHTIVLIDPLQNPDGRERFLANFEQARGLEPDASPLSAEHNEPWPTGRTNHYLFDMNRDWLAATQPETQGRIKAVREWLPLVFVDLHEMGSDSTYYFAPAADPYNPHLVASQREGMKLFGRNNARWFDRFGFDYFTREVYDAFYPGYGDSWPAFYGAIGMTYEQASVRGLVIRRADETTVRFRDSVRQHFVASLATAETAAANHELLLNNFYNFRRGALEEGSREGVREYVLPRGANGSETDKLAGLLVSMGVEVRRALAAFHAGGREFPAGSYAITMAQPAKRLLRTLLDPSTAIDTAFAKEQERRRQRKLPHEMYDITAWSLPVLFNLEAVALSEPAQGNFEAAPARLVVPGKMHGQKAALAYVAPWGSTAAGRLLTAALRADLRVFSADKPLALNGNKFSAGTLIFKVKDNPPELFERLSRLAEETGADIYPTDTGWIEEGVNFGSRFVMHVRKPNIAMAWDMPTDSSAAGWTRFVLERQFGYPVTPVRAAQLAAADLSRFHVLILPDQGRGRTYNQVLGDSGAQRLTAWVENGGTLIGLGDAVAFLAAKKVELLAISRENAAREGEAPKAQKEDTVPGKLLASDADYTKAIAADKEAPDAVPGVLVRARVDSDYWINAGVPATVNALFQGRNIYTPIKLDKGFNAAVYEEAGKVLASGYLWEENRKQLAHKPLVIVEPRGRGVVIGFTADPNYRAYLDGMNLLFLNAVFRGPAHARPLTSEE